VLHFSQPHPLSKKGDGGVGKNEIAQIVKRKEIEREERDRGGVR
jgi:hypothetical protein